ncbi:bifunctional diaminohydroxyphosphoribosylaminopyrimidine deaminase/5-amino-6-(5-phosphoribosylamino)uracil reductase RibD [Candidatus Pelagibacter sp. HTCC7211]|uniref:bifunctional diaminohydroxyphosphoribosylaminopyrimidine deaminase/5-amino-6-(5-phosphoribosylamino)uracil reductase RibD n=1 Tax=Pelagibacter sp. (strain HTCC7211) TaxID=439493 RepID=UPI0002F28E61|nr:bifunctional diaminohydroxyphosphoribosylaminopyrimidine deaminase/5-amino-6-(5-phosphoribosylamino)uracil reductase RibD [Candidatus Pelagibacter sp. HTCC7211]
MSTKKDKFSIKDKFFMDLALDLARSNEGLTGTNPSVGCIIVKHDKIISIGQTSYNGRPHAEVNAIKNSIENLNDATMYVTLEPCSHHGVTPPCTSSIIKSKLKEVIYSIIDIDQRVKGKTYKILKSKKIKVRTGLLKKKVKQFYTPYFFNRQKKLPYVSGKIAISKNNLIFSKKNRKITNIKSDKFTHFLRYKNDSILISYRTLNKDNPKLNCRLKGLEKFSPKRIILDNKLKTNTNSYLFKTANKENTIFFYNEAIKSKILEFKKNKITVLKLNIDNNKRFNPSIIFKKLYTLGCRNVLVEGGDELTKNFVSNKIFNQFFLFKGSKDLSKSFEFKEFSGLKILKKNYKKRLKINSNFGKDTITLYKN